MKNDVLKTRGLIGFGLIVLVVSGFSYLNFNNQTNLYPVNTDGKYGYINQKGHYIIPLTENQISDFQDGAAVIYKKLHNKDGSETITCQYLNEKGKVFLNPTQDGYSSVIDDDGGCSNFSEGLLLVSDKNGYWHYLNKEGKLIVSTRLKGYPNGHDAPLGEFQEGYAAFCNMENSCGYIDKSGKVAFQGFTQNGNFEKGLAYVHTKDKEGYINKKGEFIWSKKQQGGNDGE